MLITIREPKLNNKEFSFIDSIKNQKRVAKLMKKSFQDLVDSQEELSEPKEEIDTDKLSDEEQLKLETENIKKRISGYDLELKNIDETVNTLAELFQLKDEEKEILEELSLEDIGGLLAHVSFRIDNKQVSDDDYLDLMKAGTTKKSLPEKGLENTATK